MKVAVEYSSISSRISVRKPASRSSASAALASSKVGKHNIAAKHQCARHVLPVLGITLRI